MKRDRTKSEPPSWTRQEPEPEGGAGVKSRVQPVGKLTWLDLLRQEGSKVTSRRVSKQEIFILFSFSERCRETVSTATGSSPMYGFCPKKSADRKPVKRQRRGRGFIPLVEALSVHIKP